MAAGASSPELFGNVVAIYVTGSTLGVGAVLGSLMFNHLAIAAGAVAGGVLACTDVVLARWTAADSSRAATRLSIGARLAAPAGLVNIIDSIRIHSYRIRIHSYRIRSSR
mgnify:CR=1 FL=1